MACCSMSTDRVQVAQCLMTQLFRDCDCEFSSMDDKQHLKNMHDKVHIKLIHILDKLRLTNLSVEQLSSQEHHEAMCEILEIFL